MAPNKSIGSAPVSRKKKFSFKHGKMSVTEAPRVNPDTIYLEVQGREIEAWEKLVQTLSSVTHSAGNLEAKKLPFSY